MLAFLVIRLLDVESRESNVLDKEFAALPSLENCPHIGLPHAGDDEVSLGDHVQRLRLHSHAAPGHSQWPAHPLRLQVMQQGVCHPGSHRDLEPRQGDPTQINGD